MLTTGTPFAQFVVKRLGNGLQVHRIRNGGGDLCAPVHVPGWSAAVSRHRNGTLSGLPLRAPATHAFSCATPPVPMESPVITTSTLRLFMRPCSGAAAGSHIPALVQSGREPAAKLESNVNGRSPTGCPPGRARKRSVDSVGLRAEPRPQERTSRVLPNRSLMFRPGPL